MLSVLEVVICGNGGSVGGGDVWRLVMMSGE